MPQHTASPNQNITLTPSITFSKYINTKIDKLKRSALKCQTLNRCCTSNSPHHSYIGRDLPIFCPKQNQSIIASHRTVFINLKYFNTWLNRPGLQVSPTIVHFPGSIQLIQSQSTVSKYRFFY